VSSAIFADLAMLYMNGLFNKLIVQAADKTGRVITSVLPVTDWASVALQ